MQARNQSYLRRKNKEEVIRLLREKNRSFSDIARELNLSNTAVSNIADDLIGDGIITREGDTKGRRGITLKINSNFGYVFAADFSGRTLNICVADTNSKIILSRSAGEVIKFSRSDLDNMIAIMRDMMNDPILNGRKLCGIIIASPGEISDTGEFLLNPRFKGFENVSLKEVLRSAFDCDVMVKNDLNLAIEGEKAYGILKQVDNAIMLHVDVGTGAAIMIGGRVYEGCHGFAGEIGYFNLNMNSFAADSYDNLSCNNIYDNLSCFSVLSALQREISNGGKGYLYDYAKSHGIAFTQIPIDAMIAAYRAKDPLVCKFLNAAGRVIGNVAHNIAEFLDIDTIVLNGAVTELGEDYLKAVSEGLKGRTVRYSGLMEKASLMGAINAGLSAFFHNVV